MHTSCIYYNLNNTQATEKEMTHEEIKSQYPELNDDDFADAAENASANALDGVSFEEMFAASCEGIKSEKQNGTWK